MKELVKQLNQNLADVQVLYVKLHNYHWNVKGPHFFGIHKQTEEYYDYFAGVYDDVAERILQIGEKPLTTLKSYLETTKISEEIKQEFSATEEINNLVNDFEYVINEFKKTSEIDAGKNDLTSQAVDDENVAQLEKSLLMLKASK